MAKLSWVTEPNTTIANLLIGIDSELQLIVADSDYSGEPITFTQILGELPPGLTLSPTGVISGTPTYSSPSNNYFVTQDYTVYIRARGTTGSPIDAYFKFIITNTVNGDFSWITPAGKLGTAPNGEFYSLHLQAETVSASTITYSFVSGELPTGMQLLPTGYLQGVPTFLNPVVVDQDQTFRFTVRATTNLGHVLDRSFSLTITNVFGPIIEPTTEYLGTFFDGSFYSQQLNVIETNPAVQLEWSVTKGQLPPGLTLTQDGVISGYIQPLALDGNFGPAGFDGDTVSGDIITAEQRYAYGPYDFNNLNQSTSYSFTIQAFDGANYDLQDYHVEVVSRSSFTADSTNMVNDNYLTVDALNQYIPVLRNASKTLPTARQDSYYAFKFDGFDFQGDAITYSLANTEGTFDDSTNFDPLDRNDFNNGLTGSFDSFDPNGAGTNNLPGLLLDANSGWLYGKVNAQAEAITYTTFGVIVSKVVDTITYASEPIFFTLPVLGDVNNVIQWITPSNLGVINNGTVSELAIEAKSVIGKQLVYTLVDQPNLPAAMPQGLTLLTSGDISGRASFEAFTIDAFDTTFDGKATTIDRTYTFTVKAETADGTASALRQFTIALNVVDQEPYENLYLRAMPAYDQRQIYTSIISNTEIFDPAVVYRPNDPWFGVRKNIETLFLPGLNSATLDQYQTAIEKNHWTKTYTFDGIKTAVVLDSFYNVKYEVVYIDIVDPAENSSGVGPALELDLSGTIANPYIDQDNVSHEIVYPNSTENMIKRLEAGIGYADQSSLPPWMTSNQPDPTAPNKFKNPLGYTKAVVLAYTKPGAAKLIAYRLKTAGINFHNVEFSVDRYRVDDYYSQNFDSATKSYIKGRETTFDYLPAKNVGAIVAKVSYAVTVPFNQINGRPVTYIAANGGIDGTVNFEDGQTLVFAKQEQFLNPGPYDGWVNYTSAYIGDDILTNSIEGYDYGSYDTYTVIPGYLEKAQGISPTNQRAGVWKINIINGNVFLTPVLEVEVNQRVQIITGHTYSGAILYYDPILKQSQTVPAFRQYDVAGVAIGNPTTFNAGTTKFISKRDQYYTPGSQDKYLSFPQHGVFK
jgi:Putative Ig domain